MKRKAFTILWVFVITLLIFSSVNLLAADIVVTITSLTYSAEDGSYRLNWPSPRRPWRESDKEYYRVNVRLRDPAPCDMTLYFYIKQSRRFWFDKVLGTTTVDIKSGSSNGTGRFWLVCTKKGKVKGNENKNGRKAKVYLKSFRLFYAPGCPSIYLDLDYTRPEHTCRCR